MDLLLIFYVLISLLIDVNTYQFKNLTCGVDRSIASRVYEGGADIETYPWMGILFYPIGTKKITTVVVLVTRQIVMANANDIDMLPKEDLRARSRVVLGKNCEKRPSIKVRDYSFHPNFRKDTYSALAIVQLDVDISYQELRPICGPPSYFINPQFYAMTVSEDCSKGKIQIRKMKYVPIDRCKQFYNQSGLNDKMFWPSHATCARALSGEKCVWRGGTLLVVKQDGHWRLLGFGLAGPGCTSPARFVDYGKQEQWVRKSVARIGQPAITRIGSDYLVMRRPLASVQRFGPCDPEETKYEMFKDLIRLTTNLPEGKVSYNVSLMHGVEYSCIIFKVEMEETEEQERVGCDLPENPKLYLRRWCAGPQHLCYGFQYIDIHFFLEISFRFSTKLILSAYGQAGKIIDPLKALSYANALIERPKVLNHYEVMALLRLKHEQKKHLLLKHFFLAYMGHDYDWTIDRDGYFNQYRKYYNKLQALKETFNPYMNIGFEVLPSNYYLVTLSSSPPTTTTIPTTIRTTKKLLTKPTRVSKVNRKPKSK